MTGLIVEHALEVVRCVHGVLLGRIAQYSFNMIVPGTMTACSHAAGSSSRLTSRTGIDKLTRSFRRPTSLQAANAGSDQYTEIFATTLPQTSASDSFWIP